MLASLSCFVECSTLSPFCFPTRRNNKLSVFRTLVESQNRPGFEGFFEHSCEYSLDDNPLFLNDSLNIKPYPALLHSVVAQRQTERKRKSIITG